MTRVGNNKTTFFITTIALLTLFELVLYGNDLFPYYYMARSVNYIVIFSWVLVFFKPYFKGINFYAISFLPKITLPILLSMSSGQLTPQILELSINGIFFILLNVANGLFMSWSDIKQLSVKDILFFLVLPWIFILLNILLQVDNKILIAIVLLNILLSILVLQILILNHKSDRYFFVILSLTLFQLSYYLGAYSFFLSPIGYDLYFIRCFHVTGIVLILISIHRVLAKKSAIL